MADELRRERHRRLVRQPEEHEVEAPHAIEVERLEHEVGVRRRQPRVEVGGAHAGLRVGRRDDHLVLGVLRGDAQELGAGEPRRADDADAEHRRMTIQMFVWSCKH